MNELKRVPMHVLLATDDSDAARNAKDWVARARWGNHCVVDVLCVAGLGITRRGSEDADAPSGGTRGRPAVANADGITAERIASADSPADCRDEAS